MTHHPLTALTATLTTLCLGATAGAQVQLEYPSKVYAPVRSALGGEPIFGDFDGDGDLDVLGPSGVLVDNFLGRFVEFPFSFQLPQGSFLGAYDFDGDSRADLVLSGGAGIEVALNRLPLGFFSTPIPPIAGRPNHVAADFDNDGDLDLIFNAGANLVIWLGDGAGGFVDATATNAPPPARSAGLWALDYDSDGDVDLAVVDLASGQVAIVPNTGGAVFTAADPTPFPPGTVYISAIGDLDGDGDPDVIPSFGAALTNNAGTFAPRVPTFQPPTGLSAFGDLDGDGDLDFWLEETDNKPTWYENLGPGAAFVNRRAVLPPLRRTAAALALTDFDGDGRLDVVTAGYERIDILRGQPGGPIGSTFVDYTPREAADPIYGDFNGDGYVDSIGERRTTSQTSVVLTLRDGTGVAGIHNVVRASASFLTPIGAADIDGDGDLDFALQSGLAYVYFNDGSGTFTRAGSPMLPGGRDALSATFADLDGDGDQDVILESETLLAPRFDVLRNDGGGAFTQVPGWQIPVGAALVRAVATLDADGDGDVDVIVAGVSNPLLCLNDGAGNLTASPGAMPAGSVPNRPVALSLADLGADGDLDVLVRYASTGTGDNAAVYENDGRGQFAIRNIFSGPEVWLRADIVDLDLDGRMDIVASTQLQFGPQLPRTNSIYEDDGQGNFVLTLRSIPSVAMIEGQFVDVDNDGDLDFANTTPGSSGVLVNLHQQLHSPFVPAVGGSYHLELDARDGAGAAALRAWVLVSPERLASPLELPNIGRILPDPTVGVVQPIAAFGSARVRLSFPVPNLASLLGINVYSQALFALDTGSAMGPLRVTNTVRDTLVR